MCRSLDHFDISRSCCRLRRLPLENRSAILVQFDRGDNHIAGVDSDRSSGTIRLIALHTIDVDDPFLTVNLCDLSLTTLVLSPDNADLVVLANG